MAHFSLTHSLTLFSHNTAYIFPVLLVPNWNPREEGRAGTMGNSHWPTWGLQYQKSPDSERSFKTFTNSSRGLICHLMFLCFLCHAPRMGFKESHISWWHFSFINWWQASLASLACRLHQRNHSFSQVSPANLFPTAAGLSPASVLTDHGTRWKHGLSDLIQSQGSPQFHF